MLPAILLGARLKLRRPPGGSRHCCAAPSRANLLAPIPSFLSRFLPPFFRSFIHSSCPCVSFSPKISPCETPSATHTGRREPACSTINCTAICADRAIRSRPEWKRLEPRGARLHRTYFCHQPPPLLCKLNLQKKPSSLNSL